MYLVFTHIPDKSFFDVSLVEFVYLVFTRMPGESYCKRLRSFLLCSCDVSRVPVDSLCLLIAHRFWLGLVLLQITPVTGSARENHLNNTKTDRKTHRPNEESGPQKKEKDRHLGISSKSNDSFVFF